MTFSVSQKTLERLEWPEILARLEELVRTPQARARLFAEGPEGVPGAALFEPEAAGVRDRLAETAEALALLEDGQAPPIGGVADLAVSLGRARRGGALEASELLEVRAVLSALHETARFCESRREQTPRLAELALGIEDHPVLRAELETCLDPTSGEVRDEASATLADARRDARRLAGEIQQRLARTLRDPAILAALSDSYYTVRNDRYVLPVRADARAALRGIVHDASRSGTTLFVEPEAFVELNNRHREAELSIEQETRRVLRELTEAVAEAAPTLDSDLGSLAQIDLAFARARLAQAQRAVRPEVQDEAVLVLPQLRHPLLPDDESVPNDFQLGQGFRVLVLSGPNAGGKTVTLKSAALAALFVRAGLFVPAEAPARADLFDAVIADIGDEQDIREHLSTFSAHMANLATLVGQAGPRTLAVLDEVGVGTDPGEGAAIAQAALESLADAGSRVVATTHYNLLKEMAEVDERFANASVEFDPETLAPTYQLRMGLPGISSALAVAARMGLRRDVLERAERILSREERRLDQLLRELSTSRAALEHEKREAHRLRAEGEAVRAEYSHRLEKLQSRRDQLYRSMREDLDRAFRDAHEQVAGVVRNLQRGPSSRDAASAREELLDLESRARADERAAGLEEPAPPPRPALDWARARPGDPVRVDGQRPGTLAALPDRHGRVSVRMGSAKLLIPMARISAPGHASPQGRRARSEPQASEVEQQARRARSEAAPSEVDELPGGSSECDLRGLRVDEALDRLIEALDTAAARGGARLLVIHGVGTGALRRAVREHLRSSPYVSRFLPGAHEEGGEGVTEVTLER